MGTLWLGRVRTMDRQNDIQEAVFVDNGRIEAVGSVADLRETFSDRIQKIQDVRPFTIYPGFVDSHLHLMGLGLQLARLDLSTARSSAEMKESLNFEAQKTPLGEWIIGEGWNENRWPDRKIFHKHELDAISPHHPMSLTRICHHAVLVNSLALSKAGIHAETPDPPGGVIVRDDNGEPTGLLLDQAQNLIAQAMPEVSLEKLVQAGHRAMDHLISLGLVGGHTEDLAYYGKLKKPFEAYQTILKSRHFRTHLLVHHEVLDEMDENGVKPLAVMGDLSFGAMKLFADGAYGGRTAWLRRPYQDAPETMGVAIHTPEQLKDWVKKARDKQMPVAIHAIGDQAFDTALSAIEAHPNQTAMRDRLIHGQLVPPDLRKRMKKTGAILDIQPTFVLSDFPWVIERLGEDRMKDAYAWKTLIEEGIPCAGGSDAPIEKADPLLGIYAAVARKRPNETDEGYFPSQKLSIRQAVELYTTGSAYAVNQEHQMGQIHPGYLADFTILDHDLFEIDQEAIPSVKVVRTVIGGETVFERKNLD
ncbi:amidohydrolase [Pullulanibacillus sp. KACC 23026]|uniref:amidohydrolase n=1 Tax=Pullulanibacillus sp. KACC 23026 TaxID=3028315 RepID=UPI0023B04289|nr:amidohydrolase [Pullulanibacillus sp. KACC 23026]WEG13880.1 amidohydrolase [Pullulanibacillus sp. KACC 23026]